MGGMVTEKQGLAQLRLRDLLNMWENKGQIFSIYDLKSIDSDLEFAKSPQFLLVNNHPVFYFTSQKKDSSGKWVSYPYWARFNSSFSTVTDFSRQSILEKSSLGAFDEHGIFPFSPVKIDKKYLAYTTGWSRRKSVDIEMSIGLSTSNDGLNFKRMSTGPIMSSSVNEPFLVGDAFVRKYDNFFFMWYIFGDKWLNPEEGGDPQRRYRIAQAVSEDGLNWLRKGEYIICVKDRNECQALPSVVFFRNKYHMAFCYRDMFDFRSGGEGAYKLGYASSTDLENWVRDDSFFNSISDRTTWDASMQCYPNLFDDSLYCAYNGNEFGKSGFGLAKCTDLNR